MMNNRPRWTPVILTLIAVGWVVSLVYFRHRLRELEHRLIVLSAKDTNSNVTTVLSHPTTYGKNDTPPLDAFTLNRVFAAASEKAARSVVFIKGTGTGRRYIPWGWDWFWGGGYYLEEAIVTSGSGVIIHPEGYIVTNHHVIKNAEKLYVVFSDSKKEYLAQVIGTDPSTDLALLKVDRSNLPAIVLGNSDSVRIGEWVLAVGNPFNLTSSVTAGIVSAKGRRIDVNSNSPFSIESFIQTDAAINPGNSGGALVDLQGRLIGVNTAILSKTGSYIGYGFAVPVNIVRKVVEDIIEFGVVQRAFIPAHFKDIDDEVLQRVDTTLQGVLVIHIPRGSLAGQEGLREGDVILSIDGHSTRNRAEFDERLALHRPGDKVPVHIWRNGHEQTIELTLTNAVGKPQLTQPLKSVDSKILRARLRPLSSAEKVRYGIQQGVVIHELHPKSYLHLLGVPEGSILYAIDAVRIGDPRDVDRILQRKQGRILFKLIYPDGSLHTLSGFLIEH